MPGLQNTQSFEPQTKPKQKVCDKLSKHAGTTAGGCTPLRKDENQYWGGVEGREGVWPMLQKHRPLPGRAPGSSSPQALGQVSRAALGSQAGLAAPLSSDRAWGDTGVCHPFLAGRTQHRVRKWRAGLPQGSSLSTCRSRPGSSRCQHFLL